MITQFKEDGSFETKPEPIDYADALNDITWYNGIAKYVVEWMDLDSENGYISCPNYYCGPTNTYDFTFHQLQVLWMIAVLIFGDYGSSPRFGWIKDVAAFRLWVSDITRTFRYSKEESPSD